MTDFKRISVEEANVLLADQPSASVVDIRDEMSFHESHIEGSTHLGNHNLQGFTAEADHNAPLLVYCYHGNSSQNAAHYLSNQGFKDVYSIDGGYEVWRNNPPIAD